MSASDRLLQIIADCNVALGQCNWVQSLLCFGEARPLTQPLLPSGKTNAAIGDNRMNRIDRWLTITFANSDKANGILVKLVHCQECNIVRFQFLLFSVFSFCLLAVPADAGQLAAWKFDPTRNRLDFKTDAGVQPKAVMLFNPTRLVIDLPGIGFGKPTITQRLTGNFRSLRIGQFDISTTRLVLELQPGYTLNPKRVQFTGENPIDWFVTIPVPERGATTIPTLSPGSNSPR